MATKPKMWSQTIIDGITDALAANTSIKAICTSLGCSRAALNGVIDDMGLMQRADQVKAEMIADLGIDRFFYLREMKSLYYVARDGESYGDARGCLNDLAKATGITDSKQYVQFDGRIEHRSILDEVARIEESRPLVYVNCVDVLNDQ